MVLKKIHVYHYLEIIEFVPVLKSWSIEPIVPEFGESVSIRASFENQGIRSGSINVTLVENIEILGMFMIRLSLN